VRVFGRIAGEQDILTPPIPVAGVFSNSSLGGWVQVPDGVLSLIISLLSQRHGSPSSFLLFIIPPLAARDPPKAFVGLFLVALAVILAIGRWFLGGFSTSSEQIAPCKIRIVTVY